MGVFVLLVGIVVVIVCCVLYMWFWFSLVWDWGITTFCLGLGLFVCLDFVYLNVIRLGSFNLVGMCYLCYLLLLILALLKVGFGFFDCLFCCYMYCVLTWGFDSCCVGCFWLVYLFCFCLFWFGFEGGFVSLMLLLLSVLL